MVTCLESHLARMPQGQAGTRFCPSSCYTTKDLRDLFLAPERTDGLSRCDLLRLGRVMIQDAALSRVKVATERCTRPLSR